LISFLLALDPQTGKELWKTSRPNDAREESKESYATPIPFTFNIGQNCSSAGGDCLTATTSQRQGTLALGHVEPGANRPLALSLAGRRGRVGARLRAEGRAGLAPSKRAAKAHWTIQGLLGKARNEKSPPM